VKGFLPGPDPDAQRFYSSDSLIDVASPRYLLAIKLFAARAEIDADDIILPSASIPPKMRFLLTEIVDSIALPVFAVNPAR
jgi:hypothetical protein